MAFFKFRLRGQPTESPPPARRSAKNASAPTETVETLRRRARYRLIGAAVLVAVSVVVFPILFDTQPRPVASDVPITIPDRESVPPLPAPLESPAVVAHGGQVSSVHGLDEREELVDDSSSAGREAARTEPARSPARVDAPAARPAEPQAAPPVQRPAERSGDKPAPKPEPTPAPAPKPTPTPKPEPTPRPTPTPKPEPKPAPKPAESQSRADEAARARALLEGRSPGSGTAKPAAAPAGGARFIVQIGAFADANSARDVRARAERAGVKTFTQEINTAQGKRIRVRVGPYPSREEAERAAATLRKAGLPGSVLTL